MLPSHTKLKSGDLFYTINDEEIHLVLYEETGYYYCYGPLKSILPPRRLSNWRLKVEDFQQMFNENYWRVINAP